MNNKGTNPPPQRTSAKSRTQSRIQSKPVSTSAQKGVGKPVAQPTTTNTFIPGGSFRQKRTVTPVAVPEKSATGIPGGSFRAKRTVTPVVVPVKSVAVGPEAKGKKNVTITPKRVSKPNDVGQKQQQQQPQQKPKIADAPTSTTNPMPAQAQAQNKPKVPVTATKNSISAQKKIEPPPAPAPAPVASSEVPTDETEGGAQGAGFHSEEMDYDESNAHVDPKEEMNPEAILEAIKKGVAGIKSMAPKQKSKRSKPVQHAKQSKSGNMLRGRVANPIQIFFLFRYIGKLYTIVIWEAVICVAICVYITLSLYEALFELHGEFTTWALIGMDVLFLSDLFIRLATEVYRYHSRSECTFFLIPFSVGFWIWELIMLCPVEWIAMMLGLIDINAPNGAGMDMLDFLRVHRVLRISRVYQFFSWLELEQKMDEFWVFIWQFFIFYVLFIQLVACVLYGMAKKNWVLSQNGNNIDKASWMGTLELKKPAFVHLPFNHYILSISFSTSIVTTVGYGDLSPVVEGEMVIGIVIMLIGAIVMGGIFNSNLASFLLEQDGARFDLFYRVKAIEKKLRALNSSALFASTVKEYYDCLWNFREGVYHVQFIHYLPTSMHEDMLFDICTEMFHKAILFRGLEEPFLRAVCRVVEVVLYNPDMIICQQGDYAMTMYYIIQGECLVKSKHNTNITTAILRAGCVFGESSLFFSFPYATNVETRTCCQLLRLNKEKLMDVFNDHIYVLNLMRSRIQDRMAELRQFYEEIGTHPITWVQFKADVELLTLQPYSNYPTELRWSYGCNRLVQEDIVDDTETSVIVGMNCLDADLNKDNNTVYSTCVVPPTLISPNKFVHYWHIAVIVVTTVMCFIVPFNLAFRRTTTEAYYVDLLVYACRFPVTIVYFIDLFVEITTACPVSGCYYKFWDGLHVKLKEFGFYLDVLAAIPFELLFLVTLELQWLSYVATLSQCFKLWKLIRYLHFLDDAFPEHIFWFRLLQTTSLFLYTIHFLACIMFSLACETPPIATDGKPRTCKLQSWLSSYYIRSLLDEDKQVEELAPWRLANTIPYLVSVYFATSTLSSAGYGDFSPQSIIEMCVMIVSEIVGFYIVGYYTSLLTSALSCTTRPKISFQQKLVSIGQFLSIHGLSVTLRDRISEHYRLQYQFNDGVSLPPGVKHLMYDAPPYLEEDTLFAEAEIHLEGIPIFTKVDPKIIIKMAKLMDRYVLPPNIYFLRRGDVRRQMYVIYKGSVAFLKEDTNQVKSILGATGHFGDRDLLLGEPSHNNVKTLSFCLIYAIDLQSYNEVFEKDTDLQEEVEKKRESSKATINILTKVYADLGRLTYKKERVPTAVPSFIRFPTQDKPNSEFCDFEEFMEPYAGRWGAILRLILMRQTIHPAGTFALCWQLLIAIASLFLILGAVIASATLYNGFAFSLMRDFLFFLLSVDVYVKMHWAYFTESNHLVTHPVKTAAHYLFEGPFIYSYFCGGVRYHFMPFLIGVLNFKAEGNSFSWFVKLRWHSLFLIIRVPIIIEFGRNVFKMRAVVMLSMYILLTLILCTIISSYALYKACPWAIDEWDISQQHLLPACLANSWISRKEKVGDLSVYMSRWVLGVYYVCQTTLVIGYGDMVSIAKEDIHIAIFMMIVGFIILRCIISDMTAAAVDSDEVRATYSEQMKCLKAVLRRENVDPRLISNTIEHMKHTWLMSKGLQPQELLGDLHPALQSDLFREYIGDALSRVPILCGVRDTILRTVCQYMKKLYFTRGERIMRRGNLSYEMYIIVDGDVWISGKNMELKCTLGPGESMGETQMMFGVQRKYSAVAANNVEVFVLTSASFSQILDRYPTLRTDMLSNLQFSRQDLFERKIDLITKRSSALKHAKKADLSGRVQYNTAILREIVAARELPSTRDEDDDAVIEKKNPFLAWFHRSIFDYGPDDFDLPFLYLASPTVMKKCSFPPLIHPKCGFQTVFEFIVMVSCLVSPALGTYHIAFSTSCKYTDKDVYVTLKWLTWTFEIIMFINIFVQFLTPFPTVEGKFCKQYKRIAFRYVINWTRFCFDIVATLPVQLLPNSLCEPVYTSSYTPTFWETNQEFLHVIRCIRLFHYFRTQVEKKGRITITTFRYQLSISIPFFALMAHFLACVFYIISECDPHEGFCDKNNNGVDPGTWTFAFIKEFKGGQPPSPDEKPTSQLNWYIRSLYWVVTTISTTGFGDITAQNLPEIVISIICVFCGAFILSIILSDFTAGITSLTKANREYMYQVKLLAKYLTNIGLNHEKQDQVLTWFLMLWDACRGTSYSSVTKVLPLCLQIDVNLAIHEKIINEVSLFQGLDKRFIRQLANRLNHTVYLAGFNIVNEGDKGHTLYIVSKGWVAGYVGSSSNGSPKLVRWYGRGTCFGRLPVLFYNQNYTKSYRAEVTSEILYIHQKDIYHLAQNYPSFAENLQMFIKERYKPQLGVGTIFSNQQRIANIVMDHVRVKDFGQSEQDPGSRSRKRKGRKSKGGQKPRKAPKSKTKQNR